MSNSIKRTPQIPRKIRDIRPKRQLARDRESETNQLQQQDDDWWRQLENADELTHFRGGTAVNLVNRSSKTIPRTNAELAAQDNTSDKHHNGIFNTFKQLHRYIRKNKKKLFWGQMVIISWRTIYLLDVDQFINAEEEQKPHQISSVSHDVRMKSIEEELSLLNEITDDMLTSTFSKSSFVGGSESIGILTKPEILHPKSRTDEIQVLPKQTSVRLAESDEFKNYDQKDPSIQAALRHFSSPPNEKEKVGRYPDSLNSQNHLFSYLNNPIPSQHNNLLSKANGATAGLDCSDYGGPFDPSASAELVYWRDFPTDASFTSPFYNAQAQEATADSIWNTKYLTFEMDVSYLFRIHFCPDLGHLVRAFIVLVCFIPL